MLQRFAEDGPRQRPASTCYIGIDPGKSGGIAWTCDTEAHVNAMAMPDTEGDIRDALFAILAKPCGSFAAVVEDIPRFTGNKIPGSDIAPLFENFGFVKGFLMARGVRLLTVRPQKWQAIFGVGTAAACRSKTEWKNKLKGEAQKLFPDLKVTLKTADALLLMEYGFRNH
jgi:hypothetical protein